MDMDKRYYYAQDIISIKEALLCWEYELEQIHKALSKSRFYPSEDRWDKEKMIWNKIFMLSHLQSIGQEYIRVHTFEQGGVF